MTADQEEDVPRRVRGRDVLRVTFAVVGLTIGAVALLSLTYALGVMAGLPGGGVPGPLLFAVETVVVLAALHVVLIRARGFTWADLGWKPVPWSWLAAGAGASAGIYVALISIQLLIGQITGDMNWLPAPLPLFTPSIPGFAASLVFGAVTVPVAEEFLFRGVLYRWLRDRWGASVGIPLSALVFAMLHPPGAGATVQIFIIGMALAWFYERSGSLWPSMVLHGVNNAVGLVGIYAFLWLEAAP